MPVTSSPQPSMSFSTLMRDRLADRFPFDQKLVEGHLADHVAERGLRILPDGVR